MVAFFMQAADLLGIPKSIALIYGIVFASPEPLCFADVDERLDISKGSISQGLRILKEMGAIKTVERPNDRREFFEPDLELRQMIQRFLEQKVNRQLELGTQKLTLLRDKLPKNNIHHTKILDSRVSQLENWHAKTRSLMPVIKTFLKLTSLGPKTNINRDGRDGGSERKK
jgi:HTH-type transcriptional regulator, glycine betaine synthesis regulator